MAIKPFHFRLKSVSGRENRLMSAIYSYLPACGLDAVLSQGVGDAVAKHAGQGFSFRLEAVHHETYAAFLNKLSRPAVLAVIGLAPLLRKAILEIDAPLAALAIERMLGGEPHAYPEARALSDTEQGVLQYLLLQVLAEIHRTSGEDARVHFRFDRFALSEHEVRDLADADDGAAVLVFRAAFGRHTGFVRLILPDPFVEEGLLDAVSPDEERPAESAWKAKQLDRFGYVKTNLWAEAGRAAVLPGDLAQVEIGDVILFDHSQVEVSDEGPRGSVVLRVGGGMHGGIDAELSVDTKRAHCRISGIHRGE